jgi:hypothetical protein
MSQKRRYGEIMTFQLNRSLDITKAFGVADRKKRSVIAAGQSRFFL